jgi:flagellar hook protein FlgE
MPSFYIPLSGLNSDSTALNTIANNLSNMNTTGFKEQTTNFSDLFYQQVGTTGAGGEIQQGTGVQVASNSTDFTGGSISSTGVSTDAAIDGTGFFVLDNGGGEQLYTRDGNFQLSSIGTLESTEGQGVMGYAALNGVINTNGGLTDITIPTGQVMQPSATTSFSVTQNLNSASAVGTQTMGQVKVFDSLGNSYEATVTYTNLGNNKWSYAITMPDTLTAGAATAAAATTMPVTASTPAATAVPSAATVVAPVLTTVPSSVTVGAQTTTPVANSLLAAQTVPAPPAGTIIYNFVTSNGVVATVDPATTLTITGPVGVPPFVTPAITAGETLATYAANLQTAVNTANIVGVTVTATAGGKLSIVGPALTLATLGVVKQDFSGTQANYGFGSYTDPTTGLSAISTVAATSTLKISGPTANGGTVTTALPIFTPTGPPLGTTETVTDYAGDLTTALTAAGITGVTVTANALTGLLSIVGPSSVVLSGNVNQDMVGTTNNYNFKTNATVDPMTNLKISGETSTGATTAIIAPPVAAGETVAQYAAALTAALTTAGIQNISVSSTAGQLSIIGANMTTTGSVTQDLADTTISYDFGSSATVDPATSLTIVGPTVTGVPPTTITAAVTGAAGETVAAYATALNNALTLAGIDTSADGVSVTVNGGQLSIVGPANTLKVAGTASQDLTASTISYNFGTTGGVISAVDPSTNLTITGLTAVGASATTAAPAITAGETLAAYVNALTNAITTSGIAGVTVSSTAAGQLSITGANLSTSGSVIQDPVASANASGTLTFNSSGNMVSPAANLTNITFAGLSDSAATMNVTWNLYGAGGTGEISQTAATSGQSAQIQNGYTSGEYQSFKIGSDGTVSASYSNGQSQNVGQLAIATVSNQQGLVDMGSTQYQATVNSGLATVGVANSGGRGTLEGSSLEASNVNISSQFSSLIVAQRAFEANAKSVTTFDTITQETINMIH